MKRVSEFLALHGRMKSQKLLLSVAVLLLVPAVLSGCGGGSSDADNGPGEASDDAVIIDKLNGCVDDWNKDAEWRFTGASDPNVLVSTTPEGQCLVAFSSAIGSIPAFAFDRSKVGRWDTFIDSDTTDIQARLLLTEEYERERLSAPNAFLNDQSGTISFDLEAPVPDSAQLYPEIVFAPPTETCNEVVTFTGGSIGDFTLTVREATGISCQKVEQIAHNFLFLTNEWSCDGDKRMSCTRGVQSFVLVRKGGDEPASDPVQGSGGSASSGSSSGRDDWLGGSAYTAVLASLGSRSEAVEFQRDVGGTGLESGILFSSDYGSLRPGYWVVFSGSFDSESEADQRAQDARSNGYSDAYPRFVSP